MLVPVAFPVTGSYSMSGENRDMMFESVDIMMKLWTSDAPFRHEGKYWTVQLPEDEDPTRFHLRPYQQPHPPLGVTALSPKSPAMTMAGERGYIPVNLGLGNQYLKENWDTYEQAMNAAGREADRGTWRLGRDIVIADSDKEAKKRALEGPVGIVWRDYLLPLFTKFGLLGIMKHRPDIADADVTLEYLADHNWLVGSVDTVADKLATVWGESGGFGCLLTTAYDHLDHMDHWRESIRAFNDEVAPRFP